MSELDRLADENRQLRSRILHLANSSVSIEKRLDHVLADHARIEQRLQRVEDSVIFRFLRWLGGRLRSVGVSVEHGVPTLARTKDTADALDRNYSNWVEETLLQERLRTHPRSAPAAANSSPNHRPRISILLESQQPNRDRLERTLSAIDAQQCDDWELLICTRAQPPEWLQSAAAGMRLRHPIEIVVGENERSSFELALGRSRGEFLALVPADVILETHALDHWMAAAEAETVAVYSDWDHIDSGGRRHTPRFTPPMSPELLVQTLYWGRCYFAVTAQVRETRWPGGEPLRPVAEHDLALRLAQQSRPIIRVPRMLWHLQDGGPAGFEPIRGVPSRPIPARLKETASVIICSRNPEQLRKCLKALLPTLDQRHEVIVVAHHPRDQPGLEQVAASYSARAIPYEGAFHYGIMNGLGVTASKGQVVCLLNDDVYPITSDWLEMMLLQATRSEVGVVGALLLYPDGTIQHAGVAVGGWQTPAHVGRLHIESPYWPWLRITREVTAVTGACMVARRAVWDELGGLDPRFPVNYNDIDFCLRAGERGYRVLMEARAVLTHEESRTRIPQVRREESELFYERWNSVMSAPDKFLNPQLGSDADADPLALPSPWTLVR